MAETQSESLRLDGDGQDLRSEILYGRCKDGNAEALLGVGIRQLLGNLGNANANPSGLFGFVSSSANRTRGRSGSSLEFRSRNLTSAFVSSFVHRTRAHRRALLDTAQGSLRYKGADVTSCNTPVFEDGTSRSRQVVLGGCSSRYRNYYTPQGSLHQITTWQPNFA